MQMNIWIVIIIVAAVAGIILLSGKTPLRRKTREEYLRELAQFLEGQLSPLEGFENSFKILFQSAGRAFEFQDIEEKGFAGPGHKAFLRTKTDSHLTISFTEAARPTIRSNIVQASQIGEEEGSSLIIPRELKEFKIFTNNVKQANALFFDEKILDIFVNFKQLDPRGHSVVPFRVQDGWLSLEFFSGVEMQPSLFDLQHSVAKIEDYLKDFLFLAKAIEKKCQEFNP